MASCTYNCMMNVINIGNSIIGVSILAMPYCFRKCGILLSVILIFLSGILTRLACYLLLKSAIISRRRNFEFLAFHTFGYTGKLAVEISVIGFLIGVCIAFFVVIGDLGPPLAAEFLSIENSPHLRTNVLMLVGLCVALPLGMLRKIDSLTSLSALSIAFYICLILKIFAEAVPNLAANEWWYEVNWWKSEGILPSLPIFSMALSCQTQLFEFFDTQNDPSLKKMQSVVGGAVCLCSVVYIMVGTLGYIAFHDKSITGNVLVLLTPSVITEIIKLGFIITVAVSFPLCLFPCRSSLHSLIFKQGFGHHDINVTVIPELRFRILTVSLIIVTIGIAIMLPNIEFVLGIIGSTIGTLICLIFPAVMFIHDTSKNTTEKRMAQILMGIGSFILIACTYSTLQEAGSQPPPVSEQIQNIIKITPEPYMVVSSISSEIIQSPIIPLKEDLHVLDKEKEEKVVQKLVDKAPADQKRLEPPIPQEPEVKVAQNADLDPQALQKEDKEIQKDINLPSSNAVETDKKNDKNIEKQENILRKLEEQHNEQKLILEQQKKVLEELKLHKESHEELRKVDADQQPKIQVHPAQETNEKNPSLLVKADVGNKEMVVENVSKTPLPGKTSSNKVQEIPPKIKERVNVHKNVFEDVPIPKKNEFVNERLKDIPKLENMPTEKIVLNVTGVNLKDIKIPIVLVPEQPHIAISNVPVLPQNINPVIKENAKNADVYFNKREPLEDKYASEEPVKNNDINIQNVLLDRGKLPPSERI